jgi:hypothetical protein
MVPNPPPAPKPPPPKQAIKELVDETGGLLDIVENTLPPLIGEWNQFAMQNPERICIDLNSNALQDQAASLSDRFSAADKAILNILRTNRVDYSELASLIAYPAAASGDTWPIGDAAEALKSYKTAIGRLGDHPTCEQVITANISLRFFEMKAALKGLGEWYAPVQQRLSNYHDDLRKELRNAP